jgi:hypothetical protein
VGLDRSFGDLEIGSGKRGTDLKSVPLFSPSVDQQGQAQEVAIHIALSND